MEIERLEEIERTNHEMFVIKELLNATIIY